MGGGVGGACDRAVGVLTAHHHVGEVEGIGHGLLHLHLGDPLVAAELEVALQILVFVRPLVGLHHFGSRKIQAQPLGTGGDLLGVAHQAHPADSGSGHLGRRLKSPIILALGEHDMSRIGRGPAM